MTDPKYEMDNDQDQEAIVAELQTLEQELLEQEKALHKYRY